jgi:catechol 2,3-dioxygenase-like lactoylglutathione lyase family enzyme
MRAITLAVAGLVLGLSGCKGKGERDRNEPLVEAARSCARHGELSCPRPIFTVASLPASQRYYRDALGFKLDWDHGDPPDFGSVSRGDAMIFMCQGCQAPRGAWTMVFARDVDQLHRELVERQAIIKMPPTDMPWGLRELHVADPDGNVLRFGSSIEH